MVIFFGLSFLATRLFNAFSLIFHLSYFPPTSITSQEKNSPTTVVPLAPMFSHLYSCPVCFGYGMCNDVMKGSILFHGELSMSQNTRILWRKGVLQTRRVLISSLVADEWSKFDEFICRNASQPIPCDLSTASWKTILALENLLDMKTFRNLNILLDIPVSQFA